MKTATGVVVGCKEIAERLGVTQNLVATWRKRGQLPEPAGSVGGRPAWWWHDIEAWDQAGRPAMGGVGELVDR